MDFSTFSYAISELITNTIRGWVAPIIITGILLVSLLSLAIHHIPLSTLLGLHLTTFILASIITPMLDDYISSLLIKLFGFTCYLKVIGAFFTWLGNDASFYRRTAAFLFMISSAIVILIYTFVKNKEFHRIIEEQDAKQKAW